MSEELLQKLQLLQQMYEQDLIPVTEYHHRRRVLTDRQFGTLPDDMPALLRDLRPAMEIGPDDARFRLVREIGGGGMGRIWLARDLGKEELEGGEHYKALKVIAPQLQDHPHALEDLKREAIRAAELSHPNIVNVYGWRQGNDGWLFLVMEYLQGRDLDRILLDEGSPGLNWVRVLSLLRPICAALHHAHSDHHLVHRDLKLGNVIVTDQGQIKLLDFGLAYRLRRSSTILSGQDWVLGDNTAYLAPEVHVGETDSVAQDVYALACLSYELLIGEPPYNGPAAMQRDPDVLPSPPPQLSPAAWQVLCSGFAIRPENRPTSVLALLEQLITAQSSMSPSSHKDADTRIVHNLHGWPTDKVRRLQNETAAGLGLSVQFRDTLDDGHSGPTLVVLPAGEFLMGSQQDESDRLENERQHRVLLKRPFALGKYPLTFAEYDHFVQATERQPPYDQGWGRERRPVIDIDWFDAQAYVEWLSLRSGQRYRLATEAEWEYAARAGAATAFYCGAELLPKSACYQPPPGDDHSPVGTETVGHYPANAWGLHDMFGNVWEWTASLYEADYASAERSPSTAEQAGARVLRGGSWSNSGWFLRTATRFWYQPQLRNDNVGMRVLREL